MQLRRLGARGINLYAQRELCEEAQEREAEEELRLFHVGATRARERLLLSGVINPPRLPEPWDGGDRADRRRVRDRPRSRLGGRGPGAGAAAGSGGGGFEPSQIAVRVNLASAAQARSPAGGAESDPGGEVGEGPAPLVARAPPKASSRPLSYTAISAAGAGTEERLVASDRALREGDDEEPPTAPAAPCGTGGARAARVEPGERLEAPGAELVRRISSSAEVGSDSGLDPATLLTPFQAWLDSPFFAERVRAPRALRAEVPLLIEVADTVLRGSIDLLVEEDGSPPLIVDYKTDRVDGSEVARARRPLRDAAGDLRARGRRGARARREVELAYVFLERPEEPRLEGAGARRSSSRPAPVEAAIATVAGG